MDRSIFIGLFEQGGSFFEKLQEGTYKCKCCGACGGPAVTDIKHTDACILLPTLQKLYDSIPKVENSVSLGKLLPYYAELSDQDINDADELTQAMLLSNTSEERREIANSILAWCPSMEPSALYNIIAHGLKNNKARLNLRNYMVFERASQAATLNAKKQLDDLQREKERLDEQFDKLYSVVRRTHPEAMSRLKTLTSELE